MAATGFRDPTDPTELAAMRYHWYAGDGAPGFDKLVRKAQASANRTTDRAAVHAHAHGSPCDADCLIVAPQVSR